MGKIRMIEQRPTEGYDWLYEDREEDNRYFTDVVYRPEGTTPWPECTDKEREQWEHDHPQPEPETPENENKEDVQ